MEANRGKQPMFKHKTIHIYILLWLNARLSHDIPTTALSFDIPTMCHPHIILILNHRYEGLAEIAQRGQGQLAPQEQLRPAAAGPVIRKATPVDI